MRAILRSLYNNKTKLTGLLLVVIGALQTNATALQSLLTADQFAWFTVGAGVLVAVLGFMNSHKPTV